MSRTTIRKLLIGTVVFFGHFSVAVAGGLTNTQKTTLIQYLDDRIILIQGEGNWGNPDVCENETRVILLPEVLPSEAIFREIYASLLAAHLSGSDVRFRVQGCTELNNRTYPRVVRIDIY